MQTPLLKDVYQLMDVLERHGEGPLNLRLLSPRFGSVVPSGRDRDTAQLLSPNLFAFYRAEDTLLAVPELLDSTGLSAREKQLLTGLIMEASGANKVVEDTLQVLDNNSSRLLRDDVKQVTDFMKRRFHKVGAHNWAGWTLFLSTLKTSMRFLLDRFNK